MSEPTNLSPQPKLRFLASADQCRQHRKMMTDGLFQHALDMAILQYQGWLAGQTKDGNSAAMNQYKVIGAMEFIGVLKNLGESPPAPVIRNDSDNLQHEEKVTPSKRN